MSGTKHKIMENVLIVDDEIDICYFLTRNLNRKNFSASYVNNLKDAEEALDKQHPSILLLDNDLPDGRGVDFAQQIKKDHPDLKIVMITAHDTPNDRLQAIKKGVDYFIPKPFMMTEIYTALNNLKN